MKKPAMAPKSSQPQQTVPEQGLPEKAVVKVEPGSDGKYPPIPRNEAVAMNKRLSKMRKAGRTDLAEAYENPTRQTCFFYTQYRARPRVAKRKVTSTSLKWSQAGGPRSKLLRPKGLYQVVGKCIHCWPARKAPRGQQPCSSWSQTILFHKSEKHYVG